MMTTLGDDLPREIERVQELLVIYNNIGPAGAFGATMLRLALGRATRAMAEGDLPEMIRAYQDLKECN